MTLKIEAEQVSLGTTKRSNLPALSNDCLFKSHHLLTVFSNSDLSLQIFKLLERADVTRSARVCRLFHQFVSTHEDSFRKFEDRHGRIEIKTRDQKFHTVLLNGPLDCSNPNHQKYFDFGVTLLSREEFSRVHGFPFDAELFDLIVVQPAKKYGKTKMVAVKENYIFSTILRKINRVFKLTDALVFGLSGAEFQEIAHCLPDLEVVSLSCSPLIAISDIADGIETSQRLKKVRLSHGVHTLRGFFQRRAAETLEELQVRMEFRTEIVELNDAKLLELRNFKKLDIDAKTRVTRRGVKSLIDEWKERRRDIDFYRIQVPVVNPAETAADVLKELHECSGQCEQFYHVVQLISEPTTTKDLYVRFWRDGWSVSIGSEY